MIRRIPPAVRDPADPRALFILALCVASGIPLVLTDARPGSLNATMPAWMVAAWGALLVTGSLVTLVATFMKNVNGIVLEQVGSVATGGAAIVFGVAALVVAGWNASYAASFIIGWGLACLWRWAQLQSLIWRTQALVDDLHGGER